MERVIAPLVPIRGRPNLPLKVMGLALQFVSSGMFVSGLVEFGGRGDDGWALIAAGAITLAVGSVLSTAFRVGHATSATVFAAVGWTWLAVSAAGALPYLLAGTFVHWDDALFESVSGFSCTGSTVFGGYNQTIAEQGQGILFYRQLTHWFGGMGIVILAVAVLPFLGVGGLSLIAAEAPGEDADRLVPRVSETAKRFWLLYVGVTVAIAFASFLVPGIGLYDAVAHSFAAASTGGFSTKNDSIGSFDSVPFEIVLIISMIVGGASFSLHWRALTRGPRQYWRDSEFRTYMAILIGASAFVTLVLWFDDVYGFGPALRAGVFNVVSLGTSTGFGNARGSGSPGDFVGWVVAAQIALIPLMVFGGMTASTSGGMKVMRFQVGAKHAYRTLRRAIYPRGVFTVRLGRRAVPESVVERIAGFVLVYSLFIIAGVLAVTALGTDPITALGGSISSIGNMGPAFNEAGPTASFIDGFNRPARGVLMFLMLAGRLELFPMVLMFVAPARAIRQ